MQYKQYSATNKRHLNTKTNVESRSAVKKDTENLESFTETIKIPLPNKPSSETHSVHIKNKPLIRNPLNQFSGMLKNIKIDEIILIGLIFLLFDERIEDDLLMLVLVYILLTGME